MNALLAGNLRRIDSRMAGCLLEIRTLLCVRACRTVYLLLASSSTCYTLAFLLFRFVAWTVFWQSFWAWWTECELIKDRRIGTHLEFVCACFFPRVRSECKMKLLELLLFRALS